MNSILKYSIYNVLILIGFNVIGFLLALSVSPDLNVDRLSDILISMIINFISLTGLIFLGSLIIRKPIIIICLAYSLYAFSLFILYNREMELADVVWDSFSCDYKLGYVLYYLLHLEGLPQNIYLVAYITIQGILSSTLIWLFGLKDQISKIKSLVG